MVVPAGGGARRLGGIDKAAADLGGRPLLEHLLAGLPPRAPVAVVGPDRAWAPAGERLLLGCREAPPGGGPAAAVAAGVAALAGRDLLGEVVIVLPGDAPWSPAAVPALLEALRAHPHAQSAVAVDAAGRRQVLVAAHHTGPLRERLAALEALAGLAGLAGLAAGRLLPPAAALVEVVAPDAVLADVDTPQDLTDARRAAGGGH